MKYKTTLTIVLLFAGVLFTLAWATPTSRAQGGGSVSGIVRWIDQYGNARLMSGAKVTADDGLSQVSTYTTEGSYYLWLQPGTYDVIVESSPGFYPDTKAGVVVSDGSSTSIDFVLNQTGEPIPELPPWSQPLVVLSTLAITVIAVRRHKARTRA